MIYVICAMIMAQDTIVNSGFLPSNPVEADTIMAERSMLDNDVRAFRSRLGWSQEELARRSGLSRAGISAIETGRLVPSTAAALALAAALGCTVEALFRLPERSPLTNAASWAWPSHSGRAATGVPRSPDADTFIRLKSPPWDCSPTMGRSAMDRFTITPEVTRVAR